jgi:hypothetical protein
MLFGGHIAPRVCLANEARHRPFDQIPLSIEKLEDASDGCRLVGAAKK